MTDDIYRESRDPYPSRWSFQEDAPMAVSEGTDLMIIGVASDETDDEIRDFMREMKAARERRSGPIVCLLGDYDRDPREVFQIPEARATCRRLCELGFIAYLDVSTSLAPGHPASQAYGAAEVWMCAENRLKLGTTEYPESLIDEIEQVLMRANQIAEETLGPLQIQE